MEPVQVYYDHNGITAQCIQIRPRLSFCPIPGTIFIAFQALLFLTDEEDSHQDSEDDPRGRHSEGKGQLAPQRQTQEAGEEAEEAGQDSNPDLSRSRGP